MWGNRLLDWTFAKLHIHFVTVQTQRHHTYSTHVLVWQIIYSAFELYFIYSMHYFIPKCICTSKCYYIIQHVRLMSKNICKMAEHTNSQLTKAIKKQLHIKVLRQHGSQNWSTYISLISLSSVVVCSHIMCWVARSVCRIGEQHLCLVC